MAILMGAKRDDRAVVMFSRKGKAMCSNGIKVVGETFHMESETGYKRAKNNLKMS